MKWILLWIATCVFVAVAALVMFRFWECEGVNPEEVTYITACATPHVVG